MPVEEAGKGRILDLVRLMLDADIERGDFANLLSRTVLRVLNAVRGDN